MPNGELSPSANVERVSATPSPSASRSSVMRFALGTPEPASFMNFFIAQPLTPLPSSGRGGALDSATSTSPLGNTCSQRGCDRPDANALTRMPLAATGVLPLGQPLAGAILTVGINVLFGGGSVGCGPSPALGGKRAVSPQPARPSATSAQAALLRSANSARVMACS